MKNANHLSVFLSKFINTSYAIVIQQSFVPILQITIVQKDDVVRRSTESQISRKSFEEFVRTQLAQVLVEVHVSHGERRLEQSVKVGGRVSKVDGGLDAAVVRPEHVRSAAETVRQEIVIFGAEDDGEEERLHVFSVAL